MHRKIQSIIEFLDQPSRIAFKLLRCIQSTLLELHRSAIKKSRLWLVWVLLLTLLCAVSAGQLKVLLSIDDLMDGDFKTSADLKHLNSTFPDKNSLFLAVEAKDRQLNRDELCGLERWIATEVDGQEPYNQMQSAFGVQRAQENSPGWSLRPVLDPQCEKSISTVNLQAQMHELHLSPWGASLISRDERDVAINFSLNDSEQPTRFGNFDVDSVAIVLKSFKERVLTAFPELHAHFAGVSLHQYYLKKGLDQTTLLNFLMPLLAIFLFWMFFGDFRAGILFAATISIGSIIVFGIMAALNCPLDILTNILGLMLVLSSLEDYLFIIHARWSSGSQSWKTSFRELLLPGFFTSLTTAIGFASLCTSELAIIRRFGAFSAFAAILEWLLVFMILPALLQQFPRLQSWMTPPQHSRKLFKNLLRQLSQVKVPRLICMGLIIANGASLVGLTRLKFTDAPANIFPRDHVLSQDLDYIRQSRGWESQVSLVFEDFSENEKNKAVIEKIKQDANVATIESPYEMESYLTLQLKPEHAQVLKDLWRDSPPAHRWLANDGTARAIVYLKKTDTELINRLQALTTDLCADSSGRRCHLAGTLVSYTEFGDRVLSTLLSSLLLSLVLVSATLVFLMKARGHPQIIKILVSAMWGPCALIAVFWIFQFPVTFVTCTFASVVVGLAGDNTIQYLFASPRNTHLQTGVHKQALASIHVALMMILLSLIFLGSYFASIRSLTPLFVLGFLLTLVGDLWIYKYLTDQTIPEA